MESMLKPFYAILFSVSLSKIYLERQDTQRKDVYNIVVYIFVVVVAVTAISGNVKPGCSYFSWTSVTRHICR